MRRVLLSILLIATASCGLHAQTAAGQLRLVGNTHYISVEYSAGKFRWEVLDTKEVADGGTLRISKDGTRTGYQPTEYTGQAAYSAMRAALSSAVDGDAFVFDSNMVYEYDGGSPAAVTGVDNVYIGPVKLTRPVGTTYTRILTLTNCDDPIVDGFKFDGQAGITYEQSYPFNSTGAFTITNPNSVAGSYVIYANGCNRPVFKNCAIEQHAGQVTVSGSGFPFFNTAYGIQLTNCIDPFVDRCKFDYCGYSGVSSNSDGTVISRSEFDMSSWHGFRWDGGAGTSMSIIECTLTESVARLMGYRTGFDANSSTICDQILIKDTTFRHAYDWFPELAAYSAGETITLPTTDKFRYNAGEIYERLTTGAGNIPVGKTDNVDWKWLMPYTSTWQMKLSNCKVAILDNVRCEHGDNGDRIGIRSSIKLEDSVEELHILNGSWTSGQLIGVSTMVLPTDVYVHNSELNATAGAAYASRIDKAGYVELKNSRIHYDRRAWNVSTSAFTKGFKATGCKFIPWKDVYTDSEVLQESDVTAITDNIDYQDNFIVDRDTGIEYGLDVGGFANHKTANNADLRLWLTGNRHEKLWNGTLSGNFTHPVVTAGGSLSVSATYNSKNVNVRNDNWSGLGDTIAWSYDGSTLWQPAVTAFRHVVTAAADLTPNVTFATSCETSGNGDLLTGFDWSVPIPTGWEMTVSIKPTDGIDFSTAPGVDGGEFGNGPGDPWQPTFGANGRLRWNGTNWVLVGWSE